MKFLVTGAAGFIGFHLTLRLLDLKHTVIGVDNLNDYYDPKLKKLRLEKIAEHHEADRFIFFKADISDRSYMAELFDREGFDVVVNLAAQAGVRHSLEKPHDYVDSNLVGFLNILEGCRRVKVKHLLYASSSSVYGMNKGQPFSVDDSVDNPVSLYAATKKSNELMAHAYSHLFSFPVTGLRFFTVYGPYGRPDMAYFMFTDAILKGRAIRLNNNGAMSRDFTFINDIIESVVRLIDVIPHPKAGVNTAAVAAAEVLNIGNSSPESLMDLVVAIEKHTGCKAEKINTPVPPGDVLTTFADVEPLKSATGFQPKTSLDEGIGQFVSWYISYQSYISSHVGEVINLKDSEGLL